MNVLHRILSLCVFLLCTFYSSYAKDPVPSAPHTRTQLLQNKGQVTDQHARPRPDIDFKIENSGVTLFGGSGALHYQWIAEQNQNSKVKTQKDNASFLRETPTPTPLPGGETTTDVSIYRMDVVLVGANKNAKAVFEDATGYYENYYLPQCPDGATARGYSKVTYKNVYPNIDWVIYINSKVKSQNTKESSQEAGINTPRSTGGEGQGVEVKYDFIIRPGGNPADIRLRYEGATDLKMVDGALVATTPYGSITEAAPYSYVQGSKAEVGSAYVLKGNELGFNITAQYEGTLVIDPVLKWGTYYGGSLLERIYNNASDSAGNVYICGVTQSSGNIASTGAHQLSYAGNDDGFIARLNTNGSRAWATYYGGSGIETLFDIATDTFGNVYACGGSFSAGLGAGTIFQNTYAGSGDMILVKLATANGSRTWATYFGQAGGGEQGTALACDNQGNIYMGGAGAAQAGLSTTGAFLTTPAVGLLASFNSSGQRLWSSYYYTEVLAMHFDRIHNALYIGGEGLQVAGIASTGAHQSAFGGGSRDGWLARFTTGGNRTWGTYYGGTDVDYITGITTDAAGNVYAAGGSSSANNIATVGAYQAALSGISDAMLIKFNSSGQRLWGTYYGGSAGDNGYGVAVDPKNNAYLWGRTFGNSNIATLNGYQTMHGGGQRDMFMAILNGNGQRQWATFYGGAGEEQAGNISYSKGKVYCSFETNSTSGITAGTSIHQGTYAGGVDAFVIQWDVDTFVYLREPYTDTLHCAGDTLHVPYGVTQNFRPGNTFTVQLSNAAGSFASPVNIGSVTANAGGVINCPIPGNTPAGAGYKIRIIATLPADTSQLNEFNQRIYPKPANFVASVNSPVCTADTVKLTSGTTTSGVTYAWTGPNSFTSTVASPTLPNPTTAASGNYYITIDNNGCKVKDTLAVTINQTPQNVAATNNGPLCTTDTMKLNATSTTAGVSFAWHGPGAYSGASITVANAQLAQGGTYTVVAMLNGCRDSAKTTVVITQAPSVNIVPTTATTLCTYDTGQFLAFPINAGVNPALQWQVNGVDVMGATTDKLKRAGFAAGDKVRMKMTANTACPGLRYSNEIPLTIPDTKAPAVSIAADKTPPWNDHVVVTFTATPTNGGNAPAYQWRRNGQDVIGAIFSTWGVSVSDLNPNDEICVLMTSTYACPQPDTAKSNCIKAQYTGVNNIEAKGGVKVYPNPATNSLQLTVDNLQFTVSSLQLTVYNAIGQSVINKAARLNNGTTTIDVSALAAGVYMLKVSGDGEVHTVRFVKE